MSLFFQSLLIGVSIAAPVGPIGLLVIQRTLNLGTARGLATGLGAAAADALYGALGAYGASSVIGALQRLERPLAVAGAVFLAWLAWRTWRAPLATQAAAAGTPAGADGRGVLLAAFAGTFALTLSNPATILSFIAIFGTLGLASGGVESPATLVAGVAVGSALWWLLLCSGVSALRERFDARWRRAINAGSALVLLGFALWALSAAWRAPAVA